MCRYTRPVCTYSSDIGGTLVTQLETLDVLTVGSNSADGFVSRNQRERRLQGGCQNDEGWKDALDSR
jgi:hypothetical protein